MLKDAQLEDELFKQIEVLVNSIGCSLVEFTIKHTRTDVQVYGVIYNPEGTGIAECSAVSKLIYPRLEVLLNTQDINLEVTSPGLDWAIKTPREYAIFLHKGIRAYVREKTDWVCGVVAGVESDAVIITTKTGQERILFDSIVKARLDYSQEVPNHGKRNG